MGQSPDAWAGVPHVALSSAQHNHAHTGMGRAHIDTGRPARWGWGGAGKGLPIRIPLVYSREGRSMPKAKAPPQKGSRKHAW
jgi:hypothetical protein